MPIIDFTLKNPLIKGFLEGTSEYVPSGELIYVHTHLLAENFLSEIETLVNVANENILSSPKKSKKAKRLVVAAEELAKILPEINETTAPRILYVLRDVYQCLQRINDEV